MKPKKSLPLSATGPRPGDFPVGSPESRAAARMKLANAQDDPDTLRISVRTLGNKAPMGPWFRLPGGMWMQHQLRTNEESE